MNFADKALALCLIFGCSETSGYRTKKRNKRVGGHPKSRHMKGKARDIVPDNPKDKSVVVKAARKLGLVALDEWNHVHIHEL